MTVRSLNLAVLALALVLSVPALAQDPLTSGGPSAAPEPAVAAAFQAPNEQEPRTLDGSAVDRRLENEVIAAVKAYQQTPLGDGRDEARGKALETLNRLALTPAGVQSVNLHRWLGFLSLQDGRPQDAVNALKPVVDSTSMGRVSPVDLRNLAMALYQLADYDAAAVRFKALSGMPGSDAGIAHLHGSSLLLSGQNSEAATVLRSALTLASGDRRMAIMQDLAVAQVRAGDNQAALATYAELEQSNQVSGQGLAWMGYLYLRAKDYPAAIRVLEKARAAGVNTPDVLNNLGNAYQNSGNTTRAEAVYSELRGSGTSTVTYNLGVQAMRAENWTDAIKHFNDVVARAGTSEADRISLWSSHNNLGICYGKLGQTAEAAASFAKASDLNPGSFDLARNAGVSFFQVRDDAQARTYLKRAEGIKALDGETRLVLAELLVRTGDREGALAIYEAESKDRPTADVWFNIGVLRYGSGSMEGAEMAYRSALDLNPNDADSLNNLGLLLLETGRHDDAIPLFAKLAGASPNNLNARQNLAAAYVKAERLNEAIEIWREIIRADAKRVDVRLNLADAYWNLGRPNDARFHYATVLQSNPNDARANNGMGLYFLQQTENAKAEQHLRRAVQADARYLPAHVNLAIALEKQNKIAEAILMLERALKVDENYKPAQDALLRLKSASMA